MKRYFAEGVVELRLSVDHAVAILAFGGRNGATGQVEADFEVVLPHRALVQFKDGLSRLEARAEEQQASAPVKKASTSTVQETGTNKNPKREYKNTTKPVSRAKNPRKRNSVSAPVNN